MPCARSAPWRGERVLFQKPAAVRAKASVSDGTVQLARGHRRVEGDRLAEAPLPRHRLDAIGVQALEGPPREDRVDRAREGLGQRAALAIPPRVAHQVAQRERVKPARPARGRALGEPLLQERRGGHDLEHAGRRSLGRAREVALGCAPRGPDQHPPRRGVEHHHARHRQRVPLQQGRGGSLPGRLQRQRRARPTGQVDRVVAAPHEPRARRIEALHGGGDRRRRASQAAVRSDAPVGDRRGRLSLPGALRHGVVPQRHERNHRPDHPQQRHGACSIYHRGRGR